MKQMIVPRPQQALFRLEVANALRSRWALLLATTYALVFGLFAWLGLRESSVLGFTGLSRVVLNVSNAVVLVLPLVALIATCQTIVSARSNGYFELFLAQPCRRRQWFRAAVASRAAIVLVPLLLLGALALALGRIAGEVGLESIVLRTGAVTAALAWAFLGLGFLVSSVARSAERATVYALLLWLSASALHDFALIGLLLEFRLEPRFVFALAAANPVEAARLGILSGIDPELSVFGPVGFWLANALGPKLTTVIGIGWPTLLGSVAMLVAQRRFGRADLVG
jgi:ABC-2 type transport system permease protein